MVKTLEELAAKHFKFFVNDKHDCYVITLDQLRALIEEAVAVVQGDPVAYVWEDVDIDSRSIETGVLLATQLKRSPDIDETPLHHNDLSRLK